MIFKSKRESLQHRLLETISHQPLHFSIIRLYLNDFVYYTVLYLQYYCVHTIFLIKILQTTYIHIHLSLIVGYALCQLPNYSVKHDCTLSLSLYICILWDLSISSLFWGVTQRRLVVNRRFGTCRSYLQRSSSSQRRTHTHEILMSNQRCMKAPILRLRLHASEIRLSLSLSNALVFWSRKGSSMEPDCQT